MAKKKSRYNRGYNERVQKLQGHLQRLQQAADQQQQQLETTRQAQQLLAEAILQHKVMFSLLRPLTRVDNDSNSLAHNSLACAQTSWVSVKHIAGSSTEWASVLRLATATNPMLEPLLAASSEEVKALAGLTLLDMHELRCAAFPKVLALMEMLSPERYPSTLVARSSNRSSSSHMASTEATEPAPAAGEDAGEGGGAGGKEVAAADAAASPAAAAAVHRNSSDSLPGGLEMDPDLAAAELLRNLEEFKIVMNSLLRASLMVLVHNRQLVFDLCDWNMATAQRCTPPPAHYMQAGRRVRLTAQQIKHLQILLQQYNRMARQQHDAGQQLVDLSEHSLNLQASLASSSSGGSPTSDSGGGAAATGPLGDAYAGGAEEGVLLEEVLTRFIHTGADLHIVVGVWALSQLTHMQMAELLIACWPYFAYLPALVELSPFLTPDDSPQVTINASVSETAAAAAALADEVGYTGAGAFMRKRGDAMEAQLQFVLQHIQGL